MIRNTSVQIGLCVIIGLIVSTATLQTRSGRRSGYEEPCNKTLKCKSQSWLGCDPETERCGCVKPDEMTYDTTKEKCVGLLGERCKFGFDDEEERSSWYEKADCVAGAVCGPSGICSCPSGTYEDVNQTACHSVKEYGEQCTRKVECNQNKFLSCLEGECRCDLDSAVYNANSFSYYDHQYGTVTIPGDICVGRVGATCSSSRSLKKYCIKSATCNHDSNVCECSSSFTPTSELLCGLGYDQPCSASSSSKETVSVCSDQLECKGDVYSRTSRSDEIGVTSTYVRCKCPNPRFQYYDTTQKYCRGFVWAPCDPSQVNSCTEKASCIEVDGTFRCECDEEYIVTKSSKCQRAYGRSCDYGGSSIQMTESCDEVPSLKCINGSCSCPNKLDVYETDRRRCSTPVGFLCKETLECVTNANCETDPAVEGLPGRCVCKAGFRPQRNRSCGTEAISAPEVEGIEEVTEVPKSL